MGWGQTVNIKSGYKKPRPNKVRSGAQKSPHMAGLGIRGKGLDEIEAIELGAFALDHARGNPNCPGLPKPMRVQRIPNSKILDVGFDLKNAGEIHFCTPNKWFKQVENSRLSNTAHAVSNLTIPWIVARSRWVRFPMTFGACTFLTCTLVLPTLPENVVLRYSISRTPKKSNIC